MTQFFNIPFYWPYDVAILVIGIFQIILALTGWILCDLAGFRKLFQSCTLVRQEVSQLWKRDPVENLKLFHQVLREDKTGFLTPWIQESILMDGNNHPAAMADLDAFLNPVVIVPCIPHRIWYRMIIMVMSVVAFLGMAWIIVTQANFTSEQAWARVGMALFIFVFPILDYVFVDWLVIQQVRQKIESLQHLFRNHFPVLTTSQLQYSVLLNQQVMSRQMQSMSQEITSTLTESFQKQITPIIHNMSQTFDRSIKHVDEQQQQGIGKLAAHFARQLEQLLGHNLAGLSASISSLNEMHASAATRTQELLVALNQSTSLQKDAQDSAHAILGSLSASHQAVVTSTARLNEVFSNSASQISEVFSEATSQLSGTFSDATSQLSEVLTTGTASLTSSFETSSVSLSSTFADSTSRMDEIMASGADRIEQLLAASATQLQAHAAETIATVQKSYSGGADNLQAAFSAGSDLLTNRFAEGSNQLQAAFTGSTEQFASTLHTSAVEVQTALTEGSEQLRSVFTHGYEQMEQAFQTSADTLTQSLQSGSTTLQDSYTQSSTLITDLFNKGSSQLQAAFTGSTEQFASTLHTSAVEVQSALSLGSEQLRSIFTQGYEEMESAFKNSAEYLNQSLTLGSTNLQESYTKSNALLTDLFKNGSSALTQSFAAGQDQLIQTLNGATEALSQTLLKSSDMVEQLKAIIEASQADAQRIREEQVAVESQIGGYFDQMHVQINRLQDDLQANLVDIFGKYNDLTQMTLTQSDEQYQDLMTRLTESSTTLMNTLDDQVRDLTFLVRDVASEIAGLNKSLDVSVQNFGEQIQLSTQSTFQSFDQGLSDIVAQLTDTVRLIGDAVDDLPGAIISAREVLTDSSAVSASPSTTA